MSGEIEMKPLKRLKTKSVMEFDLTDGRDWQMFIFWSFPTVQVPLIFYILMKARGSEA